MIYEGYGDHRGRTDTLYLLCLVLDPGLLTDPASQIDLEYITSILTTGIPIAKVACFMKQIL